MKNCSVTGQRTPRFTFICLQRSIPLKEKLKLKVALICLVIQRATHNLSNKKHIQPLLDGCIV